MVDLKSIGAYIAEDNPAKAAEWVQLLENEIASLVQQPFGHQVFAGPYRRKVIGNYLIFYRVDEVQKEIVVVAVRHGARLTRLSHIKSLDQER